MPRILMFLLAGLAAAVCRTSLAEPAFTIARDGAAQVPIVIHQDASETIHTAAKELAAYLEQMTGAEFALTTGDGSAGIVLGTIEQFPVDELRELLAMRGPFDGKEAYAVRTEPGRLLLLGGGDLGASHAAYVLLERLGCRWFFPSPAWQVVPQRPTLTADFNEHDRPALLSRRIWYGYGAFDGRAQQDYEAWSRRNRMAASLRIDAGHAWQTIIAENRDLLAEHPEYLALVGDERRGPQLCISNAGTQQMVIDHVLDRFQREPWRDMVSVDPSDGGDHCECEPCAELGKVSNRVFHMANLAAQAVQQHEPGKWVGLYAYNMHSEPPDFDLEPNVYVQLTAGFIRGQYTFDELLDLWPKKCPNMGFYEYFSVYLWDWDRLPGGRAADVADVRDRIRRYAARNATSLDAESGNNWGLHGRGYYVANRLMWEPHADLDAILDDFYRGAFGPAAEPMRRYYERLDPGNDPLLSEHLLGLASRDLQDAWELAAERPDVRDRLEELIWYLHVVHLRWQFDRSRDDAQRKTLALEMLTHVYRTRYAYMNHWAAIRNWQARQWADEFDQPAWDPGQDEQPHPWAKDAPYTRRDTERMLAEAVRDFQPDEIEQVVYSRDLVPVDFELDIAAPTRQAYQGGVRYALYSLGGEPIVVDLTAGVIAHYRDRAAARYTFFDADDQSLQEGFLPLDGEAHEITVEVPGAGLYFLEIADSAAGWRIEADADKIVSVPLVRARGFQHFGHMQPMYFYVPAGTERISYYWSGGPHRLHGPDGQVVQEVSASGKFVHIEVPPDTDGEIWHFSQLQLGHLWFFNLPNYLAASPSALLVPREVAEADDLPIRGRAAEQ